MSTPYAFTVELAQPIGPAMDTLRAALAAEQMGIVSEVDVQATLKAKLGLDSPPARLVGVCSPRIAHQLMSIDPDIAALLPCGCGVSELAPGRTRIALQDPRMIAAASGTAEVAEAVEEVRAALERVAARLREGG
ncbi:MAG: DUF302 domain-containing protein [Gammaproteobacteria bacterium]